MAAVINHYIREFGDLPFYTALDVTNSLCFIYRTVLQDS